MHKSVPTPYKVLLGHLGVWNVVWSIFSLLLCQSSTDCGCNQRFHLVPVSCHYHKVHVQKVSVCVITLCCCQVEKKDVFFTTGFILNLVVVKHFKSAILMHSNFKIAFSLQWWTQDAPYFIFLFYSTTVFITQTIQLSTLILYLFYYNLLRYHLYDWWIKLYCNKYKPCRHKRWSGCVFMAY